VDYNPDGYDTEEQKMFFIRRLLPFVERRVNLIELAPRGTGKSYVYEKISKRGWVVSGGTVSRATLFYDNNLKTAGLVTRFDYVAFDEIQNRKFLELAQIQATLTTYMQDGVVKGFDSEIPASSGIVVLGNIEAEKFNTQVNMVDAINPIFRKNRDS
jgi:ATP-dependent Lon protease